MEYRKVLVETCNELLKIDRELLTSCVNVAMHGEYKELNDLFDYGDSFKFEWGYFQDSPDSNLEEMVSLHEHLQATLRSIIDRNNILQEELEDE